jgi:hypothetical protein
MPPQVAALERRGERINQLFKNQVTALRTACRLLLGYTIEMEATPTSLDGGDAAPATIRLRSCYARQTDVLEFQWQPDRTVRLVPTDFAAARAQDVEVYVKK